LIKNSQPFGKKFQKTIEGGDFVDSHCTSQELGLSQFPTKNQMLINDL